MDSSNLSFIHAFPKFLAEALIKVEDDESRSFLIDNIRVEKPTRNTDLDGDGLRVPKKEMLALAEGNRRAARLQSLTDWLWYVNTKGSLAEAVAATSFAIEAWRETLPAKSRRASKPIAHQPASRCGQDLQVVSRAAHYDDHSSKIALETSSATPHGEDAYARHACRKAQHSTPAQCLVTAYSGLFPAQFPTKPYMRTPREKRRTQQLRLACPTGVSANAEASTPQGRVVGSSPGFPARDKKGPVRWPFSLRLQSVLQRLHQAVEVVIAHHEVTGID